MSIKCVTARKLHRCDECGKQISIGEKYWRDYEEWSTDHRAHTNCLDYPMEPDLPFGFNQNRKSK